MSLKLLTLLCSSRLHGWSRVWRVRMALSVPVCLGRILVSWKSDNTYSNQCEYTRQALPIGCKQISDNGDDLLRGTSVRVAIKPFVYPRCGADMVDDLRHADMAAGCRYFSRNFLFFTEVWFFWPDWDRRIRTFWDFGRNLLLITMLYFLSRS